MKGEKKRDVGACGGDEKIMGKGEIGCIFDIWASVGSLSLCEKMLCIV